MIQTTMMDVPLTLDLVLERAGAMFADVEILSRLPDRSLHRTTYGELRSRARRLAKALRAAGLRPGDRVATLMWNHYGHLEAYFGIPAAGGVVHTLNLRLAPEEIAYIAAHAEDRFLIVDDVLLPLYEKLGTSVNFERVIVFALSGKSVAGHENYERFLAESDAGFEYVRLEESAPCGMCYTSGTTGRPKGVVYSHRSTVLHALGMALTDGGALSMRDTVLPVVPMFHANAWGLPYAATLTGARQVYPGPHLDPESLLDLFERTGTTISGGVPTIWMGILQALRNEPQRWRLPQGLRMVVGGSAVPPALIKGFEEFGAEVFTGWGLTETSPVASLARLRPEHERLGPDERVAVRARAGLPVPLVQVRIRNDQGIAPWDGSTVGEVEVRGPWVTGSYHRLADSGDRFTDDGWFRTGDIGFMTPDGYLTLTDRAKDLIKSGGEWISSQALENEIMAHPAVAEAAVIAVPHPKWMERPLAVVVKRQGVTVSADELRAHLAGKFPDWWMPEGFEFIDEIPRTSTGKFLKSRLREMYAEWKKAVGGRP